jgi:hypothetical protein
MKSTHFLVLINIYLFHSFVFAQSKSVSEKWCATEGTLITNSIIQDGQRVYNGPFSFTGTRAPHEGMPKGTMIIKGTKKLGLMHGPFLMERKGAHFKGERNFNLSGELSENIMIGTWKIKSKQYNSLAFKNDKYTYDKNYTLEFNKFGQILKGTRIDNDYASQTLFQTDENGYLHGKIIDKYQEGGYLIADEEIWIHGINISKCKRDVKSNQLLGKINYLVDTSIINELNFNPVENAFVNPKYEQIKLVCKNLKDSLEAQSKLLTSLTESEDFKRSINVINEKINIETITQKLQSNLNVSSNELKLYSLKKHGEKLYHSLKNKSILKVDPKNIKDIEKITLNLKKAGQIDDKSLVYFVQMQDSISILKIDEDAYFEELPLDKKTNKSLQKLFDEKVLIADSNERNIKLKLCGIDSNYFVTQSSIEFLNKEITKNQVRLQELEREIKTFGDLEKTYTQIEMKLSNFDKELTRNKSLLAKEKRMVKIQLDREAYKYIFNDVNELGDLLDCLEIKFVYKLPLIGKLEN